MVVGETVWLMKSVLKTSMDTVQARRRYRGIEHSSPETEVVSQISSVCYNIYSGYYIYSYLQ